MTDHTNTIRVGNAGDLSTELADVADLALQRAAFTLYDALDGEPGKLLTFLNVTGPRWLDLFGRFEDALGRCGFRLADLLFGGHFDPDKWDTVCADISERCPSCQQRTNSCVGRCHSCVSHYALGWGDDCPECTPLPAGTERHHCHDCGYPVTYSPAT